MRVIRYVILGTIAICLLVMALANRGDVTLNLLPEELVGFWPFANSITLPLYVVIFGGIAMGVFLGFVWEWLREHKHRAEASRARKKADQLEREITQVRKEGVDGKGTTADDVLAIMDGTR
jgi:uncharacterized integral membrane protein